MKIKTSPQSPLPGMDVGELKWVQMSLSSETVDKVFWKRLNDLTDEMFIRDGFLWRTIDMQGHGSDIDEKVAPVDDGPYNLQIQAIRLKMALVTASV